MKIKILEDEKFPYFTESTRDYCNFEIEMTEDELSQWKAALAEIDKWERIIHNRHVGIPDDAT